MSITADMVRIEGNKMGPVIKNTPVEVMGTGPDCIIHIRDASRNNERVLDLSLDRDQVRALRGVLAALEG